MVSRTQEKILNILGTRELTAKQIHSEVNHKFNRFSNIKLSCIF